jgi:hypothetical protein
VSAVDRIDLFPSAMRTLDSGHRRIKGRGSDKASIKGKYFDMAFRIGCDVRQMAGYRTNSARLVKSLVARKGRECGRSGFLKRANMLAWKNVMTPRRYPLEIILLTLAVLHSSGVTKAAAPESQAGLILVADGKPRAALVLSEDALASMSTKVGGRAKGCVQQSIGTRAGSGWRDSGILPENLRRGAADCGSGRRPAGIRVCLCRQFGRRPAGRCGARQGDRSVRVCPGCQLHAGCHSPVTGGRLLRRLRAVRAIGGTTAAAIRTYYWAQPCLRWPRDKEISAARDQE